MIKLGVGKRGNFGNRVGGEGTGIIGYDSCGRIPTGMNGTIEFGKNIGTTPSASNDDKRPKETGRMFPTVRSLDLHMSDKNKRTRLEIIRVNRVGIMTREGVSRKESGL